MNIVDIINKKRKGLELSYDEIKYAVDNFLSGNVVDAQMSSLLMAIVIRGMSDQETFDLTDIMLHSGNIIDLSDIDGIKVDKHSTGGVGDKTSLALVPLVASCGVKVAKMSGRSLGHTGGTIDKLESIPGFNVALSQSDFIDQVNRIGCALISQTSELVPADKKIYALRDLTATVESIPLIASSIMSKKLASGVDKIVIDVKVGADAFMKDINQARELARLMVAIGKSQGKDTVCVLTNMEQPLGNYVGNALEVYESIEVLKGNGPADLVEVIKTLASYMVSLGKNISVDEARLLVEDNLSNGNAYNKFIEMVNAQGGNIDDVKISSKVFSVKSSKSGFIRDIDAYKLGMLERSLTDGRFNGNNSFDHSVGFRLNKKNGDYVLEDEELLSVYLNEKDIDVKSILDCFDISESCGELAPLIYEIVE